MNYGHLWVPRFAVQRLGVCPDATRRMTPRPSDVMIHGPVQVKQGISLQGLKDDCLLSRILLSWNWQYTGLIGRFAQLNNSAGVHCMCWDSWIEFDCNAGRIYLPLTSLEEFLPRTTGTYDKAVSQDSDKRFLGTVAEPFKFSLLAGFLPFSTIYIEVHCIVASMWGHQIYTLFGILLLAFVLLVIVPSFITVALLYFQLA